MKRERCLRCAVELDVYDDVVECFNCASVMRVLSWDPLKLQTIEDRLPEEARIGDERETVNINDVDSIIASNQIREINISNQAHALRFLRLTDYVLVILCGSSLLGFISQLVVDPELRQGIGGLIFALVIIAVYLFSVYTGFRHVGVIDARVWRAYIIAFPALLLLCSFFAFVLIMILAFTDDKERVDENTVPALLMYLFIDAVALLGFVSVLLLRRMRIAHLGIQLVELLSHLRSQRGVRTPSLRGIKRVNTPLGLCYGILGGVLILGNTLPDDLRGANDFLQITQFLGWLGVLLFLRARRYFQISADSLLSVDKRSPILFLRSFNDDEKQRYRTSERAILDFSLETRLSNHFTYYGPFIALGSPRETVPELGAARVRLSDSEWQPRVRNWMSNASLIIMYSGKTHWVNWELAQVIEMERVANLILMTPEIKDRLYADPNEEISTRIERVKEIFKNTRWSGALAAFRDFQDARAILFEGDGAIIVIKSRPRNRDSYHLAALIAHYIILNRAVAP